MNFKYINNENKYKIFENGDVYNEKDMMIPKYFNKKTNTYSIFIKLNNKNKQFTLHTLLYNLFIGEINKGHYICFKDNNFNNIHISNLIKVSRKTNKHKILFDKNEWNYIPNYEERYIINRKGIVKSLVTNKILEDYHNEKFEQSYKSVKLTNKDGQRNSYLIHRLVYQTFIGEIDKNMVIDHIDQYKFNNKLENLRMVSPSDNSKNCNRKKYSKNNNEVKSNIFVNLETKYKNIDLSKYEINEYGQIRNVKTKLLLKPSKNKMYDRICLFDSKNNRQTYFVHKLVGYVFLENPNNYPIINHKDENKENNHISNLEWTTHINNITYSQGKKIGQYSLKDEFIKEYESINDVFRELKKQYGANIRLVCEGKRKTAFGYKWKWL